MNELLLAVLERFPSRVRRLVIAAGAVVALAAVMVALTLTASPGERHRQPVRHRPSSGRVQRASPPRLGPPVSTTAIDQARRVAERFLAGYLRSAYGRDGARAVSGITSALRRRLVHERAELTPVERHRRPRVVSLQTTATTPKFVVATAVIGDGGVTTYRLRFTLDGRAGRWLVSGVQEG
ncbi:MAG TPA: hypothetical protein VG293_09970 [Solirubrobacteraceae bacterium]|nr:hypothetical protein [Solirubrobacteraceae bacterium]